MTICKSLLVCLIYTELTLQLWIIAVPPISSMWLKAGTLSSWGKNSNALEVQCSALFSHHDWHIETGRLKCAKLGYVIHITTCYLLHWSQTQFSLHMQETLDEVYRCAFKNRIVPSSDVMTDMLYCAWYKGRSLPLCSCASLQYALGLLWAQWAWGPRFHQMVTRRTWETSGSPYPWLLIACTTPLGEGMLSWNILDFLITWKYPVHSFFEIFLDKPLRCC